MEGFPEQRPVFEITDPSRDDAWDAVIDETYANGSCVYKIDGKYYELTVEHLTPPDAAWETA